MPLNKRLHLDSAYDSKEIHTLLFNKNYIPQITKNRRRSENVPIRNNSSVRWSVERTHSWINRFQRLFVRFEKKASNYLALVHFSCSSIISNKIKCI